MQVPQWIGSSRSLICCVSPSAMVVFTPTPQAHRTSGGALIKTPAGKKLSRVIRYTLGFTNSSLPAPSHFPKSVIGKVVQLLPKDQHPGPVLTPFAEFSNNAIVCVWCADTALHLWHLTSSQGALAQMVPKPWWSDLSVYSKPLISTISIRRLEYCCLLL